MHPIITSALYWKGFIAKLVLSCVVTVAIAIQTGITGVDEWSSLTGTQQLGIIVGIIALAGKDLISLMDKTYSSLVSAQEDDNNPDAPAPLATKAENPENPKG